MTNTKALAGGLLGAAIGLSLPGAGFLFALRGFAIGFSIGSFLFPPELEDTGEKERFNVTGPNPSSPIPIIWGRRNTPGSIIYFGFDDWEKVKIGRNEDEERHYFAPMQIAVCISDWARVKIRDSQQKRWKIRAYFLAGIPSTTSYHPATKEQLQAVPQTSQGAIESQGDRLSRPFLSQGGDPIDTYQEFAVNGINSGRYRTVHQEGGGTRRVYEGPQTYSFWPNKSKLPPLKGVVTLSHPRWYMGEGTNAPSLIFEVWNEIDLSSSAFTWAVTYPELDEGQDFRTHKGMNPAHCYWSVLTDQRSFFGLSETLLDEDSFLYAEGLFESEGYRLNSVISSFTSVKALLEELNFHTNCVVRATLGGKLELLPLRRLDDVTNPKIDWDNEILDPPVAGKPTVFVVRDGDLKDIDVSTDTWDSIPNEFTARFPNKKKSFDDDNHTIRNEAGKYMTGKWIRKNYQFSMFTDRTLVNRRLLELMRFNSRPKSIVSLVLDHRYHTLRKNDGILLYSNEFQLDGVYLRVSEVEHGDMGESRISIKAVLDTESLAAGIDDLTVDDEFSGPIETALSAIDIGAHVEYWPSNVAFPDTVSSAALPERSPATEVFGTQLYAARKSDYATDCCVQAALGLLTATSNTGANDSLLLPETSPCTQPLSDWGFRFNLAQDVYKDDHRYSLIPSDGGSGILVRLSSYEEHDLSLEAALAEKATDVDLESDPWVAILTGTPVDQLNDEVLNIPSIVEVWRFKKLVQIETSLDQEGTLYELQGVLRQANKEHPQGWNAGQELWIARVYNHSDLPSVPGGVEGSIGGVAGNFTFTSREFDSWIQLYNDPSNLRNGQGGVGAPPAITGATGLQPTGHIVTDGIITYSEGADYEIDHETGMFYAYSSGDLPASTPLTVTLLLSLSSRWAHRHLSAAEGSSVSALGAQRVRLYSQSRRIEGGEIIDAEGPLEGIRRDFDRRDSNFFSGEDRRRAAISPFTGAVAFKASDSGTYKLYDRGAEENRCVIIQDLQHTLAYQNIDWPAAFFESPGTSEWRIPGANITNFSIGFSGEFDQEGRVFSFDTEQGGAKSTNRGFVVRIENHTYPLPYGTRRVPVVQIINAGGDQFLYPVDGGGVGPGSYILGWNIQTPNIVITFYVEANEVTCDFYIGGFWIGKASTTGISSIVSTGGNMNIGNAHSITASTGHYWDFWLCPHRLSAAETALGSLAAPSNCLFFLPLREPVGTTTMVDISGLHNDFVKQSGTLTADALSLGGADFDDSGYYIQFPPHSERDGLGDAWLENTSVPSGWRLLTNDLGTEGADEADIHTYANGTKYPEHQTNWYRLDVYVRWTGLETNPVTGEAFLLRSGRRYALSDLSLYDPMLEIEIDEARNKAVLNGDWWPTFCYSNSMMEHDKARYEATTVAADADWREADLIFVMYKCKGEVDQQVVGLRIKSWNAPTIVPIYGRDTLNYFGDASQRVHGGQVNNG